MTRNLQCNQRKFVSFVVMTLQLTQSRIQELLEPKLPPYLSHLEGEKFSSSSKCSHASRSKSSGYGSGSGRSSGYGGSSLGMKQKFSNVQNQLVKLHNMQQCILFYVEVPKEQEKKSTISSSSSTKQSSTISDHTSTTSESGVSLGKGSDTM